MLAFINRSLIYSLIPTRLHYLRLAIDQNQQTDIWCRQVAKTTSGDHNMSPRQTSHIHGKCAGECNASYICIAELESVVIVDDLTCLPGHHGERC